MHHLNHLFIYFISLWYVETWTYILFLALKVFPQYLQLYRKEFGKWMFSTCFLMLLLSWLTFPQRVHLWALGPLAGSFSMYSAKVLPTPSRENKNQSWYLKCLLLDIDQTILEHISVVCLGNMHVQIIPCCKVFCAVLAVIREGSWKMNIFHMLSEISSVIPNFPTKCALMRLGTRAWIFYYVLIKQTSVFS